MHDVYRHKAEHLMMMMMVCCSTAVAVLFKTRHGLAVYNTPNVRK